jgi:hypothetical protein
MVLETELAYYETIKPELLKHYGGKFVLVIGNEQLGVFDRREDAYMRGIELRGNVPMLISKIEQTELIY